MKRAIIIGVFCLLMSNQATGQEEEQNYREYFSKDQLSFSLNSTPFIQKDKTTDLSPFSRGIALQMMYPVLGNKRNVALAIGFGLANQNYYMNTFIRTHTDSVWMPRIPDSLNHKKYKLSTTFLTVPIELRFRTDPSGDSRISYKFYPGFRVGYLLSSHTKYVGTNPNTGDKVKEKHYYVNHLQTFDYGITLRMGRGKFMVNGYYSLVPLFDPEKTTEFTRFEVGLTVVLF